MTEIQTCRLTKTFGPVAAVREMSFTAPAGKVTGFLGPNGSGKTTTLRMVLGLVRSEVAQTVDHVVIVSAGQVRFDGPLADVGGQAALETAFLQLTATAG